MAGRQGQLRRPEKRTEVRQTLVRWITEQGLRPGERILGQSQLATLLGTTPVTVHKALTELAADGVVHRRDGVGTFVGPAPAAMVRTRTICLVLPGEHLDDPQYNPYYWPYVQSLYRAFLDVVGDRWTFSTRVVSPATDPRNAARHLRGLAGVFFHHTKEPVALWRYLVRERIVPTVAFGLPRLDVPCLTVDHDATGGTRKGVSHLLELGYRRIALVCSRHAWGDYWRDGYRLALREYSLRGDSRRIVRIDDPREGGAEAVAELARRGVTYDAVFADTDLHGLRVVEALRAAGRRVPQDVGVMGLDGLDLAVHHPPHLTSLAIPYRQMIAYALAELERGAGAPTPDHHERFIGEVIAGRTAVRRTAP